MDFRGIVEDVAELTSNLIQEILNMDVSPDVKILQISRVFGGIAPDFAKKLYDDTSRVFDSAAIRSTIDVNADDQIERLAQKIVRDNAFGLDDKAITKEYYDTVLGRVQDTAFRNAVSLQKHPTLTRIMVGETCAWCAARTGTFTNPDSELFKRHDNCDCKFIVSGYATRNGILKNYKKGK